MIYCIAAGLFGIASDFTSKYAPYQSVQMGPHPSGGAYICSTREGKITFLAVDAAGLAPQVINFLPDKEICKAARFIKIAERTLTINTESQVATVATHQKTADKTVEFRAPLVSQLFPDLFKVLAQCDLLWSQKDRLSPHAGCYDPGLVREGMDAIASLNALRSGRQEGDRVIVSSCDGGPMLLEVPDVRAMVLVMPHKASPLPGTPGWVKALLNVRSESP
jgi:hypothetical protein